MHTILIAIDDQAISMLLSEELFEEGYSIRTISDPWMLSQTIQRDRPDLEDDIVQRSVVTQERRIFFEGARKAMGASLGTLHPSRAKEVGKGEIHG